MDRWNCDRGRFALDNIISYRTLSAAGEMVSCSGSPSAQLATVDGCASWLAHDPQHHDCMIDLAGHVAILGEIA